MRKLAWAGLATVIAVTPSMASAQTCLGSPTGANKFAIGAEVQLPESAKTYLGTFNADLSPIAFRVAAGITKIDDVDDSGTNVDALVAYKLMESSRLAVCPAVGVRYITFDGEEDGIEASISQTAIPVGLSLGTTLLTGPVGLGVYAFPHFLYVRSKFEMGDDEVSFEVTDDSNEFGADIGARLLFSRFTVGAGVNLTSIEESDPVFNISLGFLFGRR